MHVEYGTACATLASDVYNLGDGMHKSGVHISPLSAADEAHNPLPAEHCLKKTPDSFPSY